MREWCSRDGRVRLLLDDCREAMVGLPRVETCITDPPYGLSFMGQGWDRGVPGAEFWVRVGLLLRPGATVLAFGGTRTWHRLACAIEDAGFEIRDTLMWMYGCLDEQTECLTRTGWKTQDTLTERDEVCQWDPETGTLSWTCPMHVHRYPYDGELVRLVNRHTDQALTSNHRVLAKVRRHARHAKPERYEVVEAGDVAKRSSSWAVDLPLAGVLPGEGGPSPGVAYLVGWWLTDAWKHGDGKAAMFSQCKPDTLAKLRRALEPYPYSEYTNKGKLPQHKDEHTFYVTGALAETLLQDYPDRLLTWEMVSWAYESRLALFNGLIDGDGTRRDGQHTCVFWSKVPARRDVFLALALSLGFRAYEDARKGCVHVNVKRSTTQLQGKHRTAPERYRGVVWCVTVPTGAFVVRRNGRPFITGNSGFPKSLDISKAIDKAAGAEREVVGRYSPPGREQWGLVSNGARSEVGPTGHSGRASSLGITAPATREAKLWEGWGTALKPAFEPIIMAMKPLDGTFAANALEHGVAGLNVDGCRIDAPDGKSARTGHSSKESPVHVFGPKRMHAEPDGKGRWPANAVLDEEAGAMLDEQSGNVRSSGGGGNRTGKQGGKGLGYMGNEADGGRSAQYSGTGGASRFFYCAKASRSERTHNGSVENKHPTVKPIDLMRWLCRLTATPTGGTVLDPFMGTGTTGLAALAEGRAFIGIEENPEAFETAVRRFEATE